MKKKTPFLQFMLRYLVLHNISHNLDGSDNEKQQKVEH